MTPFAHRAHNQGRAFAAHRLNERRRLRRGPAVDRARLNAFAEALADRGTVVAAARAIGVCPQRGSQLLARLRAELGWQAK